MKKSLTTILLVAVAMFGGFLSARHLDAQVTYSPAHGETLKGTADPSSGAGVTASEGTLYVRTGSTDQLWQKTGAAATAWTNIAGGAASFSSLTVSGNITSTTGNIVATAGDVTAGDDLIATDDVTSTDAIVAGNGLTVNTGNVVVTAGTITASSNIVSSSGNITATAGDVTAGDDLIASDDISVVDIAATGQIATTAAGSAAQPALKMSSGGLYDTGGSTAITYSGGVFFSFSGSGIQVLNAIFDIAHGFKTTSIISPTQITGNQTDYNPFGGNLHLTNEVRLTSDAARTINSMLNGSSGQRLRLWNANTSGTSTLTLLHDDGATGTAAQRFLCPNNANAVITAGGSVDLWYDTASSRWRVQKGY